MIQPEGRCFASVSLAQLISISSNRTRERTPLVMIYTYVKRYTYIYTCTFTTLGLEHCRSRIGKSFANLNHSVLFCDSISSTSFLFWDFFSKHVPDIFPDWPNIMSDFENLSVNKSWLLY